MLYYRFEERGERIAMLIRFDAAGDALTMHEHTPPNFHDVFVQCGSVLVTGPDGAWSHKLSAGDGTLILSDAEQHHEIVALEGGTVVENVYKQPRPNLVRMIGKDWVLDA